MNGRAAKKIRKMAGFIPSADRLYGTVEFNRYRRDRMLRLIPMTMRTIFSKDGSNRSYYQGLKAVYKKKSLSNRTWTNPRLDRMYRG